MPLRITGYLLVISAAVEGGSGKRGGTDLNAGERMEHTSDGRTALFENTQVRLVRVLVITLTSTNPFELLHQEVQNYPD